jgi:hypothetical protein
LFKKATLSVLSLAFPPGLGPASDWFQRVLLAAFSILARLRTTPLWFSHAKDRLRHLDPLAPSFCEAGAGQPFADSSFQFSVMSKEN